MEKLLEEFFFRKHIFVFLNPEDIFNLGECSSQMKDIVLNNLTHPLGTQLQYLKTRKNYLINYHPYMMKLTCLNTLNYAQNQTVVVFCSINEGIVLY